MRASSLLLSGDARSPKLFKCTPTGDLGPLKKPVFIGLCSRANYRAAPALKCRGETRVLLAQAHRWGSRRTVCRRRQLVRRDAMMHLAKRVAPGVNVRAPPGFAHSLGEGADGGPYNVRRTEIPPDAATHRKKRPRWDHYDLYVGCSQTRDVSAYFLHNKQ